MPSCNSLFKMGPLGLFGSMWPVLCEKRTFHPENGERKNLFIVVNLVPRTVVVFKLGLPMSVICLWPIYINRRLVFWGDLYVLVYIMYMGHGHQALADVSPNPRKALL